MKQLQIFTVAFGIIIISILFQTEAQNVANGYYEKHEECAVPEGVHVMKCRPMQNSQCNVSGQVPCSVWAEMDEG
jgi:hypothetical protein